MSTSVKRAEVADNFIVTVTLTLSATIVIIGFYNCREPNFREIFILKCYNFEILYKQRVHQ